ncbi:MULTISPECIES: SPOR domain-containing protein [Mangrovimonas]|uniref:SPOR domain-containing protein n=1 Tax=Mangrovimonas TaxID=1211036 RepID=UPI00142000C6|nr:MULTISPECIES: SPOR domain-containing protein [Mangrovimonas]MCF1421660.1 SPOR domain-containing protein [Mangrovimonas futianensis]NIK90559.1 SPOR domain-containing protein [Mangrovimonas sp. CR14]
MLKPNQIKLNLSILITVICMGTGFSQSGQVEINQDKKIDQLLAIKKEVNASNEYSDRYKIQIFSGNLSGAEKSVTEFKKKYESWSCKMDFETPNYKVRVGNFRSRLEADKALATIKKEFPAAFIFKPKRRS